MRHSWADGLSCTNLLRSPEQTGDTRGRLHRRQSTRSSPETPVRAARGQVEPLAALAAVFAVAAALSIYAGVIADFPGTESEREIGETVLDGVAEEITTAGVTHVLTTLNVSTVVPDGWQANATLQTGQMIRRVGPEPPASAQRASRRVAVRIGPGTVRPGKLQVAVWQ
jgi:hypothetical protein